MLAPYTLASKTLTKGKHAKKSQQASLWGSWPTKQKLLSAAEKELSRVNFHEITELWTIRAKGMSFDDVHRLEGRCRELGGAVKKTVTGHYAKLKDSSLKRPADVAVYFALKDLGKKIQKDEPKFEAQFIYSAIEQII